VSGVKDRAAIAALALLDIAVTVLREHPELHHYTRAGLARILDRARPEYEAYLRQEFHEVQQTTINECR
jgi:hypothetical protein